MNRISTVIASSEFVREPHMNFAIDGVVLDQFLEDWYPDRGFLGLIPTTLNWLMLEAEQAVVWERFLNRACEWSSVPILCCPDDLDFSCALVMVDARFAGSTVEWRAFGFDQTDFDILPQKVGSSVWWLPPRERLIFDRAEYDNVANEFRSWAQSTTSNES